MRLSLTALMFVIISLQQTAELSAHEGVHERIKLLTTQITADPDNATLYLKRGELYRAHRDWDAALGDYRRAEELDESVAEVHYYRGRMWLEAGHAQKSRPELDLFLSGHPEHIDALLTHSRTLMELGEPAAAADDLGRIITLAASPTPEFYLEHARALLESGNSLAAVQTLDNGIERLGPIVTLVSEAIELDCQTRRFETALSRIETLPDQLRAQPHWLFRKGEILQLAGNAKAADVAFAEAKKAIDNYPPHRRGTAAIQDLLERLEAK